MEEVGNGNKRCHDFISSPSPHTSDDSLCAGSHKHRKTMWTDAENRQLTALVRASREDINWHEIAAAFDNKRSAKRCRERWVEYLDPTLSSAPFTKEEDGIIMTQHARYGNKWKKIAEALHTHKRSATAVKTRYFYLKRNIEQPPFPVSSLFQMDNYSTKPCDHSSRDSPQESPELNVCAPMTPTSNYDGLQFWLSQASEEDDPIFFDSD